MRSTMHKQNSFITRYCLAGVVLVALIGPLAGESRGDFILQDDEQLTVRSAHNQGYLYDTSHVSIVSGGSVTHLYAYGSSKVDISSGSVTNLYAYGSSTVNISGGYVQNINAFDWSTMNIFGGSVPYGASLPNLHARNSSTVKISVGEMNSLYAYDSSAVSMSGGSLKADYVSGTGLLGGHLYAYGLSTVAISGGSVSGHFYAYDSSTVSMSGGSVSGNLYAENSSTVNISGGSLSAILASDSSAVSMAGGSVSGGLQTENSSTLDISGGSMSGNLYAMDSSTITFHGLDFRVVGGLVFDGDYVLGTGLLGGKWFDGTLWAVYITEHGSSATILAIPESAHKPLCVTYPAMDFDGNCKVDFGDLAIFLESWLECNLEPESACWE